MISNRKVKDPVCGMEINVHSSTLTSNYMGMDYYFCAPTCLKQFEKKPEEFVEVAAETTEPHATNHDHYAHHHHGAGSHCCGGNGHCNHQHHECHEHNHN